MEAAVSLYQESGDTENLVRLILSQGGLLMSQGRHQTLEQWLSRVPEPLIGKQPWLLYWRGNALLPSKPAAATPEFEKAFALFDGQDDRAGILLSLCGLFDSILLAFSSFKRFDPWIPVLLARCASDFSTLAPELQVRVIGCLLFAFNSGRRETGWIPDQPGECRVSGSFAWQLVCQRFLPFPRLMPKRKQIPF